MVLLLNIVSTILFVVLHPVTRGVQLCGLLLGTAALWRHSYHLQGDLGAAVQVGGHLGHPAESCHH